MNFIFTLQYAAILKEFCTSIVFENGAEYKPQIESPVDGSDGFQSLEMLYGLTGQFNLIEMNKKYDDQIPKKFIVIGESAGGNLICIERDSGSVYFWHHEAEFENSTFFKINGDIDQFIMSLKEDSQQNILNGVIESESFLDF